MQSVKEYKDLVIKIGSSLFCSKDNTLDYGIINSIAEDILSLLKEGRRVTVVSSGAIAMGMSALGFKERPGKLYDLQAAAAIGQNELMNVYRNAFKAKGFMAAQVLLTWEDFDDRKRYLNAKNTLSALLKRKVVPVINENDTVSTDEIKFGDNDQLSARVASLLNADMLIILSDVDGLMDKAKSVISVVDKITPQIKSLACPTSKKTCVGGMITKIEAAKIATGSGVSCVIANGRKKGIISKAVSDPALSGTLFIADNSGLASKQRWIAYGTRPKARIIIDEGAKAALLNKKSLLSVGVTGFIGAFASGDTVSVFSVKENQEIARGKACISSKDLDRVKGKHSDKEVIHRDNIAILG